MARERASTFPDESFVMEPEGGRPLTINSFDIPRRYRDCSFDNFIGNDKLVEKVMAMSGESIVLTGNTGCGKTHLAIAAMRHGIERGAIGIGAIFIPVPELLLKIRSSFREGARETEADVIDRYAGCSCLILDDLGAEKTSEYSIATMELIIDRRYRSEAQTIITTNLSLLDIEEKLSARIASRLSEMNPIKINMPDYRKGAK